MSKNTERQKKIDSKGGTGENKNIPSRTVTLPSYEEIMARLREVDMGENENLAEKFYPRIADEAGRRLAAGGIFVMLSLKIDDFVSSGYSPLMISILDQNIPQFIDALVDDKEIATEAKRLYQEARRLTLRAGGGFKSQ